ncbi:HAD family hydrolase [Vagococcus vulneris]|uniref:HAD family hydrolase n=1 Tax=Vagococcus vulneris TaxID=1977869 RepID=A0A429ZWS5_9ENTE|nr:HAD family phosphatase [Vagococcus vulneris]RST98066.1 hypothetical protein CBF37_09190 [Vagococcus vulneris]
MKKISGVIFDMDGLLLDTEAIYCEYNIKYAKKWGLTGYDEHAYREEIGLGEKAVYEKYFNDYSELPREAIENFFNETRGAIQKEFDRDGAPLKPGVVELINYLKENKIPIAVASSNNRVAVDNLLTKAGILKEFDAVVSGDDVTHAKPHPEIVEKAVAALGTKSEETLMLEDALNGVRAAYAASVPVIMVPDILPPDDEVREKAYAIEPDLFAVKEFIKTR